MGAPTLSVQASAVEGPEESTTLLASFDEILAGVAQRSRQSAESGAHQLDLNEEFLTAFNNACQTVVIPAMKSAVDRLRGHGGDGMIETHPGGEPRFRSPSVVLWICLEGSIVGSPRQDQLPYLQVEADLATRKVSIAEGDMWKGIGGGSSGAAGSWEVADLTTARVLAEIVAIARRAAA
jgi:hypothetical protein